MSHSAVVIGAGPNGLSCARELATAGLSVTVVEAESSAGGMARTDELLGPGLVHHPHGLFLGYRETMPAAAELQRLGVSYAVPEAQHAIVFEDGRRGIVIYRIDQLERTRESVARYSTSDANILVAMLKGARTLGSPMRSFMLNPPSGGSAARYLKAVQRAFGGLGLADGLGTRTASQLICETFEADEVRTLLLLLSHELGGSLEDPGGDVGFLGLVTWLIGDRAFPLGGMGAVARAMTVLAEVAGARVLLDSRVTEILNSDGAAAGVRLSDGAIVTGDVVVSTLSAETTRTLAGVADCDGPASLYPAPITVRQHLILREPLNYRSAAGEPALNAAAQVYFGWDDAISVIRRSRELAMGTLPQPGGVAYPLTTIDGSLSTGYPFVAIDATFPGGLTDAEESDIRKVLGKATATRLNHYAQSPQVVDGYVDPFGHAERHVDLSRGVHHYRSDLRSLFVAGSGTHPGGGVHGACGYNAAHAVLNELATDY